MAALLEKMTKEYVFRSVLKIKKDSKRIVLQDYYDSLY